MSSGYKFMYKFIQAAWINEVRFTIRINQASFNIGYWGQNSFWRFICHSGLRNGYKINLIHRFHCGQRCRMPNIILAGSAWPRNILFVYFNCLFYLFICVCLFVSNTGGVQDLSRPAKIDEAVPIPGYTKLLYLWFWSELIVLKLANSYILYIKNNPVS